MKHTDTKQTEPGDDDLARTLTLVARGDHAAYEELYRELAPPVFGLIKRVLRDSAQSEEVAQEVLLEIWRSASRYDPGKGSPAAWAMTIAHRRAVDRVRSEEAAARHQQQAAPNAEDQVTDEVEAALDQQQVRRCLGVLTNLQRESVTLAYYGGYSYPQVAALLGVALGTVKTRIRDGLTRLRDCMGVVW